MSDFPNGLTVTGTLSVAGSEVPTLTSTSTLTNKTLTAPVLANPSYSGTTANGGTVTTIDINGGTIDGTVIGGTTPAAVSATTLAASGFTSFNESALFNNGKRSYWYEPGTTTWLSMYSPSLNNLDVASSGGTVARFTAGVGLAVTGALSATGWSTQTNGDTTTVTTSSAFRKLSNTSGDFFVATDSSAGNSFAAGGVAYAANYYLGYAAPHIWSTSGTERMRLDTSGNLGLGVTPSAWAANFTALQLKNGSALWNPYSGTGVVLSSNTYYGASGERYIGSADPAAMYRQLSGVHSWFTAPSGTAGNAITFTQAMTLDASGNLLVGGTTGNFRLLAKRSTAGTVVGIWNTAEEATQIAFHNIAGGAVGSVTVTASTTAYNTTSDHRLKENITDASDAASLIDALQVRQFDWKSDGSHQRYGFVAQELYEVAPEAVSKPQDPDEMMAVDYSKLVPMLVKELQSLRARVAQLEGI